MTNPYKFSVYRAAAFTATSGSVIAYDTELFDSNNNHSAGRYTAPINGFYWFNAAINQSIAGGNVTAVSLYKNGSEIKRGTESVQGATGGFAKQDTVSALLQLSASDYIEVVPLGNSGAGSPGQATTYFQGYLVSSL